MPLRESSPEEVPPENGLIAAITALWHFLSSKIH